MPAWFLHTIYSDTEKSAGIVNRLAMAKLARQESPSTHIGASRIFGHTCARNVVEHEWEVVVGKLQIVWRNPNPVKHTNRWYANPLSATLGAVRYVIEELVGDASSGYWSIKTSLEVLSSAERAA
jgi:hypothetical protein